MKVFFVGMLVRTVVNGWIDHDVSVFVTNSHEDHLASRYPVGTRIERMLLGKSRWLEASYILPGGYQLNNLADEEGKKQNLMT